MGLKLSKIHIIAVLILVVANGEVLGADLDAFVNFEENVHQLWKTDYRSINEQRIHFVFKNITTGQKVHLSIYQGENDDESKETWNRKLIAHTSAESPNGTPYKIMVNEEKHFFDTESDTHQGRFYTHGSLFTYIHSTDHEADTSLPYFYKLFEMVNKKLKPSLKRNL